MPEIYAIDYQTDSINNKEIPRINEQKDTYTQLSNYQMNMYSSVKYVNEILIIFYIILFSVIHLLFLVQYIQRIKRNEVSDIIWLIVFFLYPYLIYYIEKSIYFIITYPIALIYGQSYVFEFDKFLLFSNYYADPGMNNPTGTLSY